MVGCVVVRDGAILSEGFHQRFGEAHAEVVALEPLGDAKGATVYVSLEPCNHHGKTPPCAGALVEAGVTRVVYGASDPGAESGGGADWLRAQGVDVLGPLVSSERATAENPLFFGNYGDRPFVALKLAVSLDGGIAPSPSRRMQLTGSDAQAEVQRLRAGFGAILVGGGTWKADDPSLTVRGSVTPRVPPLRVFLDRSGEFPVNAKTFSADGVGGRAVLVTELGRGDHLRGRMGDRVDVLEVPTREGANSQPRLDISAALKTLKERGVRSVLCEGGGTLAGSLLNAGLVDRIYWFLTPKTIGGAVTPALQGVVQESAWRLAFPPESFGEDVLSVFDRIL